MTFRNLLFLTDENIQPLVVSFLRNLSIDVLDVKEEKLAGKADSFLLEKAFDQKRIIITHDSDFGRLVALNKLPFTGIIYLRPGHVDPAKSIQSLSSIAEADIDFLPPFIIVAEHTGEHINIRYRQW